MPAATPSTTPPAPPVKSYYVTLTVAVLLALYLIMALGASVYKGPSFDEEEQLATGYNIWVNKDFRMESADGDFIKRWATLPYLISRPRPAATNTDYWRDAKPYRFGFEFFFLDGNKPQWLLLQGRLMAALLGALTGFLVFYCSRELFGPLGGIFSLILFVFSPHMLAFGGMVSTDMSISLMLLGATWSVWRLLHRVTWGRLALGLLFVSLLILAKPSGLVIFPITFVLILVKLFSGLPLEWQLGRPRVWRSPKIQLAVFAGLLVLHTFVAWAVLWAHYDFRFRATPDTENPTLLLTYYANTDPVDPRLAAFMDWLSDEHVLPEGFLHGIYILLTSNERRQSFMDGEWAVGGWRTFFLHALWDKTSPALMILVAIGLTGWTIKRHRQSAASAAEGGNPTGPPLPSFYDGMPYFVLAGVYFVIALLQDLDIGHRHIMPIYLAIYILTGGSLAVLWVRSKYVIKVATTLLLTGFALESLLLFPNYLAYFNPFVGGPKKGYQHLVDSSLDWGMDLPGVQRWLQVNNPHNREPVYLAYFGTDSPEYEGIKSFRLPCNPDWRPLDVYPLGPGIYIISATLYQSVYTRTFGPWNTEYEQHYINSLNNILKYEAARKDPAQLAELLKLRPMEFWNEEYGWLEKFRFARLCAWLRHHRPAPDAMIGYSMLIWRINQKELEEALLGPPPEIDDAPLF